MNTRDIGLNYGAGKGDAPRYTANETWKQNFDAINWGDPGKRAEGFRKVGNRQVKRYGGFDKPPSLCD